MSQPRDPITGRYLETETDRHNQLLSVITARPAKHAGLIDAMYPALTTQTPNE